MISFYDVKQSVQRLFQDYGYSAIVISTMALTLAVALFLFTMVYTVQYKPLPDVDNPENIAWASMSQNGFAFNLGGLSNSNYRYLEQHQSTLDHFGRVEPRGVTLATEKFTEQIRGIAVSPSMFKVLGINPLKGRTLVESDEVHGSQKNIVISYHLWNSLFNLDENVIGQTVKLDGSASSIVGVMPKGFKFPINHDVWLADPVYTKDHLAHAGWNSFFGRLKPGVSMEDAQEEFSRLYQEIKKVYPNEYKGKSLAIIGFTQRFSANMGFLLSILSIASVAILLMGCFSVCNLIIVRNLENAKEALIKTALGVPISRVVVGLLLETFWLCLVSAVIGLWLCYLVIQFFGRDLLDGPYWWTMEFQTPIALIGLGAAGVIWLGTGVIPVWMANRRPTNGLLSSGRKGGTGSTLNRVMQGFSALQIFSAFILMVFTGVLIGGLLRMANADYGVPREGFLTAEVKLGGPNYATIQQRNDYYDRFVDQVSQLSGVQSVAVTSALPGSWGYRSNYTSTERNIEINNSYPQSNEMPVNEHYFETMEIEFIEGRNFTVADKVGAEEVAIINQSMANTLFPGEQAAGRQFQYDPEKGGQLITVVGVVPDVVSGSPLFFLSPRSEGLRSQLYRPMRQKQPGWDSNTLVIKTDGNPYDLVSDVKAAAREVDSEIPIYWVQSYDDFLKNNESGFRRLILTFTPAALLALAISAMGIYSMTRRVVLQSTPDIGVMRAIGVEERFINRTYLVTTLVQLAFGVTLGTVFSIYVLPSLPDGILVTNTETILSSAAVVAAIIGVLVVAASLLPLLKAHRMSPKEAMNFLSFGSE